MLQALSLTLRRVQTSWPKPASVAQLLILRLKIVGSHRTQRRPPRDIHTVSKSAASTQLSGSSVRSPRRSASSSPSEETWSGSNKQKDAREAPKTPKTPRPVPSTLIREEGADQQSKVPRQQTPAQTEPSVRRDRTPRSRTTKHRTPMLPTGPARACLLGPVLPVKLQIRRGLRTKLFFHGQTYPWKRPCGITLSTLRRTSNSKEVTRARLAP